MQIIYEEIDRLERKLYGLRTGKGIFPMLSLYAGEINEKLKLPLLVAGTGCLVGGVFLTAATIGLGLAIASAPYHGFKLVEKGAKKVKDGIRR